jgi:ParB family chromosome partitioning protein
MQIEKIAVTELSFDPSNARKHSEKNIEAIKGSLRKFQQQKPLVVSKDNIVLAGNGTLQAAIALGWKEVDIVRSHLTGAEAMAYSLADNRVAELAEWDQDILGGQLQALFEDGFEIGEFGFDDCDFLKSKSDSPFENKESEKSNNDKMIMCPNCSHSFSQK